MKQTKLERDFQRSFVKELKDLFKGCIVLKNDSSYIQGIPDWSIFFKDKWAMLEIKRSIKAKRQANQEYYVNLMNGMSFARFVYPENKEEVLNELKKFFKVD